MVEDPNMEVVRASLIEKAKRSAERAGADIREVARIIRGHAQFVLSLAEELERG
jgi:hypothetical protein